MLLVLKLPTIGIALSKGRLLSVATKKDISFLYRDGRF